MLYEAWERFTELLRLCPHHGIQRCMILQTLYNGVTQPLRSTIDAATRGPLMNKAEDAAYNFIEEMALNNFQLSSKIAQHK